MTRPPVTLTSIAIAPLGIGLLALVSWVLLSVQRLEVDVARLDERITALISTLEDRGDEIAALRTRVGRLEGRGR